MTSDHGLSEKNIVLEPKEGPAKGSTLSRLPLSTFDKTEAYLDNLLRLANISEGSVVLEPGCGPGRFSPRLAQAVGAEGKVLSCDASAHMIRRLRNRELPRNVLSFVSSVRTLPLKDDLCDCIVYLNGFQPIADKAQCLREFSRVLKKGGQLWLAGFDENGQSSSVPGASVSAGLPARPAMMDFLKHAGLQLMMFRTDPKEYVLKAVKTA